MYYYIKNLQGDIVKIIDQSGAEAASYKYDSWGKITAESGNSVIRELNPFRYRGYVYDTETGLYYLQSRYYDPITGRFLNADIYCDTQSGSPLSTNMFAYCENNAVGKSDPNGMDAYWLQDKKAVSGFGHTSLLIQEAPGKWWYFYWGDYDIQLLYFGKGNLAALNKFLHGYKVRAGRGRRNNPWGYNFYPNNNYTDWERIKGNFKGCLSYIFYTLMKKPKNKKISSYSFLYNNKKYKNKNYDRFKRNCVQVSIEVLLKGTFKGDNNRFTDAFKRSMLKKALKETLPAPNAVYKYLWDNYFFVI